MDILKQLFERHFGEPAERVQLMQGELGGSGRKIFRLAAGGKTAIGILSADRKENAAFLEFSRHFRRHGLAVPEIHAEDQKQGAYLEQDLGDTTLFQFLSANRQGGEIAPAVVTAYKEAAATLPDFQVTAGRDLNYRVCYPRSSFDRQSIAWDLNYFKYYFLKLAGVAYDEQRLEDDFRRLTKFLLTADRDHFLYRDFQSRNIMLHEGKVWFLDYQGGRKGALQYDIASLLYDAKADLPPDLRQHLLEHYLESLRRRVEIDRQAFMRLFYGFVYVRIMQALGAYGFRGFYERKPHFLQSVPYALKNLHWLLEHGTLPIELPTLTNAFRSMVESERLQDLGTEPAKAAGAAEPLSVRIFSFSYKRGCPEDASGNGGGFVFDCRALPNPGRDERFQRFSGLDARVVEYLEQQDSVHRFLSGVRALVDSSVSEYQRRGFKNLMVCFGCTGGQHRSVYLAEQLAQHLRARNRVNVVVEHRDQEHWVK